VGDLVWRFFLLSIRSNPPEDARLWEGTDGALLGFAWIDQHNHGFDWQIRPEARWQGLEEEMLRWVEARHAAMGEAGRGGEEHGLETGAMADDEPRVDFLRRHGFEAAQQGLVHMTLDLLYGDAPPPLDLPPGYTVRPVAGPHEAPARAAVHRQAFHPSRVDDASYARLMLLPGYDRRLDTVAVAPDGMTMAACAMAWMDELNRVGEFEPVGTAPAFRRLGLGKAVLVEGLWAMKAAGAETAIVATWADWEPARRLYESVGFEVVNSEFDFLRGDE
jgi:ribosomal protein S18 acetylase RimI-like enzyme